MLIRCKKSEHIIDVTLETKVHMKVRSSTVGLYSCTTWPRDHVVVLSSLNDFTAIRIFNEHKIMQQHFINILTLHCYPWRIVGFKCSEE
jgi:hypothetical protein